MDLVGVCVCVCVLGPATYLMFLTLAWAVPDISTVVGLSRFRNLQHLDLGNNDLKRFNGGDAAKLHTLVLESNDMTTLQSSRFPSSLR